MKKIFTISMLLLGSQIFSQTVEVDVFQKGATASTDTVGFRVHTTSGTVDYQGVSFYLLYQSAKAAPQSTGMNSVVGVDDSKMVTTFGWGSGNRNTNPIFDVGSIDPAGGLSQSYNRRYIYGNSDGAGGANAKTLTTAWDTLLYITFNSLSGSYPQAGFVYEQATSEAGGAALTDLFFSNISFIVNSGDRALGLGTVPVLFTNYNVQCNDKGALLTWGTATEQNTSKFEIQRSKDGAIWSAIDNVAAAGNSSNDRSYQYLDLQGGAAFYRIRQVDADGKSVYTDIKRTTCESKNFTVVLYPVPAKENLTVVIKSDKAVRTELQIMDINGKLLRRIPTQINSGSNNISVNVKDLAAGQYLLTSSDPELPINKKFVVAR